MKRRFWADGVCSRCWSVVIETASDDTKHDYVNFCSNPKCIEHKKHYCFDIQELQYYNDDVHISVSETFNEDSAVLFESL